MTKAKPTPAEVTQAAQMMADKFNKNGFLRHEVAFNLVSKVSESLVTRRMVIRNRVTRVRRISEAVRTEFTQFCPDAIYHPKRGSNDKHWSRIPKRKPKRRRKPKSPPALAK